MSDHTAKAFDAELDLIGSKIAEMGGIAENMLINSIGAISRIDKGLANEVLNNDHLLDSMQR